MPTSSRLSRQLLLASILCLNFTVRLIAVAVAQEQATHDAGATSADLTSSTAPVLSFMAPASVAVGSGGFTLTLSGSNFLPTSKVLWNGSPRPVKFDTSSQIEATISAQDVLLLGTNTVIVSNPAVGHSSPATLSVYLPLPKSRFEGDGIDPRSDVFSRGMGRQYLCDESRGLSGKCIYGSGRGGIRNDL
jgi:hypothetical protein